jgi:hypothetical protein
LNPTPQATTFRRANRLRVCARLVSTAALSADNISSLAMIYPLGSMRPDAAPMRAQRAHLLNVDLGFIQYTTKHNAMQCVCANAPLSRYAEYKLCS